MLWTFTARSKARDSTMSICTSANDQWMDTRYCLTWQTGTTSSPYPDQFAYTVKHNSIHWIPGYSWKRMYVPPPANTMIIFNNNHYYWSSTVHEVNRESTRTKRSKRLLSHYWGFKVTRLRLKFRFSVVTWNEYMRSIPDPDSTSAPLLAIFKKLASTALWWTWHSYITEFTRNTLEVLVWGLLWSCCSLV